MKTAIFLRLLTHPFSLAALAIALGVAGCQEPGADADRPPRPGTVTHHGGPDHTEKEVIPPAGSPAWMAMLDTRLKISENGHGPDIGSAEWRDAVGRKSGVTDGSGHGPDPGSDEWNRAVDRKVFGRR